jgi:hypothetical protein
VRAERGEVIDTGGRTSGETDVILVDHESNAFRLGGESVVPVEAAVAIVEVKSSLTGKNLEEAIRKMALAKTLSRTQHHGFYRGGHGDERIPIPPRQTNGYIIGYEGPSISHILNTLLQNPDWYASNFMSNGPEIICILTKGFVYKNDFHFFDPELTNRDWIMVGVENRPGMQHIIHNVQETLQCYGGLTYELGAYHGNAG